MIYQIINTYGRWKHKKINTLIIYKWILNPEKIYYLLQILQELFFNLNKQNPLIFKFYVAHNNLKNAKTDILKWIDEYLQKSGYLVISTTLTHTSLGFVNFFDVTSWMRLFLSSSYHKCVLQVASEEKNKEFIPP